MFGPSRDKKYIINMDQTPVYFLMNPSKTLDFIGTKTIHIRVMAGASMHITLAFLVTAAGNFLMPMMKNSMRV